MRRAFRRVVGAACWLLVLVCIPAGLTVVDIRLSTDVDWVKIPLQPLTAANAIVIATVIGWALWTWLVYTTIAATISLWRTHRRTSRHLPVSLHAAVSAVTSVLVLASDAITGQPSTATAPPAGPQPATAAPSPDITSAPPTPGPNGSSRTDVDDHHSWGWLPAPAAGAVAAIVALAWADRQRRYQPRLTPGAPRADIDPVPTLPGLTPIDTPLPEGYPPEPAATDPIVGSTVDGWLHLDHLPPKLALTGPGATDAARALLTTITTHDDTAPTALLTHADADTLVGDAGSATRGVLPHAHLAANLADLLDHAVTSTGRAVLLYLGATDQAMVNRLDTALARIAGRLTVVLLSPAGDTPTWHIAADGSVLATPEGASTRASSPQGRRLAVLSRDAAIAQLSAANPASEPGPRPAANDVTPQAGTIPEGDDAALLPTGQRAPQLHLQVLGPPTLLARDETGTTRPVRIRRTAGIHLLVYLAIHRYGATTDELKEALWPDASIDSASDRLSTNLSELRRTFHTAIDTAVLDTTPDPSRRGHAHHRLDPHHITVDLWHLQDLLHDAATTTDDEHRHALLRRGARLATGELAHGLAADWIGPHRETTTYDIVDVFHTLTDAEPDHHHAIALLKQALRLAPHTEVLYQNLMRRHAALQDHDAVARTYTTLTEHLADQRTQPAAATTQLLHELTGQSPVDPLPDHDMNSYQR